MIIVSWFLAVLLWLPLVGQAAPSAVAQISQQVPVQQIQTMTPETVLERLFTTDQVLADWFTEEFLRQVPLAGMQPILNDIKATLGQFQRVEATENGYLVRFERGQVPAQIGLNARNQIAMLWFQPPETPLTLEEAIAEIATFPGDASLLIRHNQRDLAAVNADMPLGVGSAFKLAVLMGLRSAIAAGDASWEQVVTLQPEWKSLPSGLLQDWPNGSSLTLETLATLMISISDNTATDSLIHWLGRETIEPRSSRNQPFLTTRDFFALKNPANADLLERYRQGSTAQRRQLLPDLATAPLPDAELFNGNPIALDVEWQFTTRALCDLMAQVQDLPLMSVNPGVANPQDWQRIAFKGGSEPGILNLTTWLQNQAGDSYCVAATWNDPTQPLNETELTGFYRSVLNELASRP